MPTFHLRFPPSDIPRWEQAYWAASRPPDIAAETHIETVIAPFIREHRYLTREHFLALVHWKSPRSITYAARNDEDHIRAVTHTSLTTDNERLRIRVLTLLSGVQWPMASVILHFGYDNLYPILDVRALWSAGVDEPETLPAYDFDLWWAYTLFCRQTAAEAGVGMRMLDRALWGYSKRNPI